VKKYDEVNSAPTATATADRLDEGTSGTSEDGPASASQERIEISLFLEFPIEAEASAAGLDVRGITDAELVGLADSPEKDAEIERRLAQTPEVNQLSHRFLAADEEDHDGTLRVLEALVRLIQELLKEQRIRRIPRQPGDERNETLRERIELAVCLRLLPFKDVRTANEITLIAPLRPAAALSRIGSGPPTPIRMFRTNEGRLNCLRHSQVPPPNETEQ
jgi:hypothetical protein